MSQISSAASPVTGIVRSAFGKTADGTPVDLFTLRNADGLEARISNYGGTIVSLIAPDRAGRMGDIVLGFDTLEGYVKHRSYFGALVGRCGNRIAQGKFTLNGVNYSLAINNGPNSIHGGLKGFDKAVWQAQPRESEGGPAVELTYLSADGEEGYPGALSVTAVYTLTSSNELCLDCTATTSHDTIVNLTQHSYFNLAGQGDVLGHQVYIDADRIVAVDHNLIPTGELRPVAGTPFDLRHPAVMGERIGQKDEQLTLGHGFDHTFVLNHPPGQLGLAARVTDPVTGRVLEVLTTEPGVQFYTGNFLDGSAKGKGGRVYERRNGFCLEAQHFPDSPNHPDFPSIVLKPGEVYQNTTVFRLSVQ
jgi:aldose 1-epimerase